MDYFYELRNQNPTFKEDNYVKRIIYRINYAV